MPSTPAFARIEGIVAREANLAVVFRRGPTRHTQTLLWDLNTDEVTPGQWIRARVNVRQCDVTPDGQLLVAGLYDAASRRHVAEAPDLHSQSGWTAISRPPYLTALAVWFDQYGLGGFWSSPRDLNLSFYSYSQGVPHVGSLPASVSFHLLERESIIFHERLKRDGWQRVAASRLVRLTDEEAGTEAERDEMDPAVREVLRQSSFLRDTNVGTMRWERKFADGRLVRLQDRGFFSSESILLQDQAEHTHLTFNRSWNSWGWIDLDAHGRVIYAKEGCLWAWEGFPSGMPSLIADLNANRFQALPAPDWAREWPSNLSRFGARLGKP